MVRPLFFSPCDWEVAGLVSNYATTRPRRLFHSTLSTHGDHIYEHWIGKNAEESGFSHLIENEYICAQLAAEVGLSVPECRVEQIGERTWFISHYINNEPFTYPKLQNCRNIADIPLLLLFDLWVCNPDRSPSNLLLSPTNNHSGTYEFIVIDHSHALFGETDIIRVLDVNPRLCFDFPALTERIRSNRDWNLALFKLQSLSEQTICEAVNALCDNTFLASDIDLVVGKLAERKDQLPGLLYRAKTLGCFPNWL